MEGAAAGGIDGSRIYRQFVAANSKDKADDLGVAFGQLRDAMATDAGKSPVVGKQEMPRKLRRLEKAGEIILALGFVWTALYTVFIEFGGEYGYAEGFRPPLRWGSA